MPVRADSMFILADDLSGAADCAVGGAQAGLKSIVLLDHSVAESAEVVAVDADTRYRTPELSRAISLAIWRSHSASGRLFYKKIDSTLRGHFATDTSALVGAGMAIVAPAFPQAGRTTREGRVFVKGVPLERTEIWSNERMSGEAELVAMLRAEGVSALNVPLATVRGDLGRELTRLVSGGQVQAVVCDAEEDADLEAIAGASVGLPVYWVGSAGLVAHLLRAAGLEGRASPPRLAIAAPIVTVVGSLSTASRRQARVLECHADLCVLALSPDTLRTGEGHPLWQSLSDDVGRALSGGKDVMIRTEVGRHDDLAMGHVLCESLGRLLEAVAPRVGALVATGGETARALLLAFGVQGLQLIREVEPGIPLSLSLGRRSIPVITKAGAFGSSEALLRSYRALVAIRSPDAAGIAKRDA
jgi:4-hydroxythreonine-4-phosphate dehydrogenase